jgi:hypothetical protein
VSNDRQGRVAKLVPAGELPLVAERWIYSISGPPIVESVLHHCLSSPLVKPLISIVIKNQLHEKNEVE